MEQNSKKDFFDHSHEILKQIGIYWVTSEFSTGGICGTVDVVSDPSYCDIDILKNSHDKYSDNVIEVMKGQYISDVIKNDYQTWRLGSSYWLNCPCGYGKTTFICNMLPYFKKNDYVVVYTAPRTQLMLQTKHKIAKILNDDLQECPIEFLDSIENIQNFVYFVSYQKLGAIYEKSNEVFRSDVLLNKKVVFIADEVHWFTEDCLFSKAPDYVLKPMLDQFKNSLKIFITATDYDVVPLIGDALHSTPKLYMPYPRCLSFVPVMDCNGHKSCMNIQKYIMCGNCNLEYHYELRNNPAIMQEIPAQKSFNKCYLGEGFDSDGVSTFYFDNYKQLIEKINNSSENEKWLIYVENKERGQKLATEINGCEFIFSENRIKKLTIEAESEKKSINKNQSFKSKVLVTTAILDSGVSIHDETVKHIVITSWNPVTMIQFIGRKRRDKNGLNLYFLNRTIDEIAEYLKKQIIKPLRQMKQFPKESFAQRDNNGKNIAELLNKELLYYDNGNLVYNKLGYLKLIRMRDYLIHIIKGFDYGELTFIAHQLELLGLSIDECKPIDYDKKSELYNNLMDYLSGLVGQMLSIDQYKKANNDLDNYLIDLYGSTVIRPNPNSKHETNTYNKIFSDKKIPFTLDEINDPSPYNKKDKIYRFSRIEINAESEKISKDEINV